MTSASPPSRPWLCERCGDRFADPGDCPRCDAEPLVDLEDPTVRAWVAEQDVQRQRRRSYRIGAAVFSGLGLLYGALLTATLMFAPTAPVWEGSSVHQRSRTLPRRCPPPIPGGPGGTRAHPESRPP
ncbi:MAG: hypothetical protein H6739_26035 [Alphaproteobacteria bacterium]|nr:hypothetical protein [Alphaproteobacteria bacterium]